MFSESDLNAGWTTGVDPYGAGGGDPYGAGGGDASLLGDFFASVTDVGSDWARLYLDNKYQDNTLYGADQYGAYPIGRPVDRSITGYLKNNAVLLIGGALAGLLIWKVI